MKIITFFLGCVLCLNSVINEAQVPPILNFQGRVQVGTNDFNGSGLFKFALVSASGAVTYWSNDGSSAGGSQPAVALSLPVTRGLYTIALGNTAVPGMQPISPGVFSNGDVHLRVWFNDQVNGFQQFVPDQRVTTAGYAMLAANAQSATSVPPGTITSAMLVSGAVTADKLAPGAVTAAIAPGSISGSAVTDGSITSDKLAPIPIPTGGILTLVGTNSTNIASNISWLQPPSKEGALQLEYSAITRRPRSLGLTSRVPPPWTVQRPLTTDFSWKEWVREFAGSTDSRRTAIIRFAEGPTVTMSNSFPTAYSIEVSKAGFLEIMTIQSESITIR
jgi:hypothetical protein